MKYKERIMSISAIAAAPVMAGGGASKSASATSKAPDGDGDKGVEPAKGGATATTGGSPLSQLKSGAPVYG